MSITDLWNWLTSNTANVIALCALAATFWQAYLSRKHNKLSVTPYLTTWETMLDGYVIFKIQNNGVGPARIKSFNIFVDGHRVIGEQLEPHEKCLNIIFSDYKFEWYGSYLGIDHMMPSLREEVLFGIKFTGEPPTKLEFNHRIKRVKVLIDYESIYKEKFKYDSEVEIKKQNN